MQLPHRLGPRFIACCFLLLPTGGTAADLATTLRVAAKDVVEVCQQKEIRSLGVLKFLVRKDGKFSDSAGTINALLAKRLEVALVLANDPIQPLTLIRDASSVARSLDGASHLSRQGRQPLFAAKFPAMWGERQVSADGFVTGVCTVSDDLKTLEFSLLLASRTDNRLEAVGPDRVAEVTSSVLIESGESFRTRGAFDGGQIETGQEFPDDLPGGLGTESGKEAGQNNAKKAGKPETLVSLAKKVKGRETVHPLADPDAAVRLQVRYDGQAVPFEIRDGRALLREPTSGQRVELILTKDSTPKRYGVVVKVNGQNTLKKQVLPDAQCAKWILDEPRQRAGIRGYQINADEFEEFRVLNRDDSKAREVDYGAEVGTLSITVFGEGQLARPKLDEDDQEAELVESGKLPDASASSFGALKAQLLADANRGLIVEGNRIEGKINVVKFQAGETPLMSATATYYTP